MISLNKNVSSEAITKRGKFSNIIHTAEDGVLSIIVLLAENHTLADNQLTIGDMKPGRRRVSRCTIAVFIIGCVCANVVALVHFLRTWNRENSVFDGVSEWHWMPIDSHEAELGVQVSRHPAADTGRIILGDCLLVRRDEGAFD